MRDDGVLMQHYGDERCDGMQMRMMIFCHGAGMIMPTP